MLFQQDGQAVQKRNRVAQQGNIRISAGVLGNILWLLMLHFLQQDDQINHCWAQIMERLADIRDVHPVTAAANARQSHRERILKGLIAQV